MQRALSGFILSESRRFDAKMPFHANLGDGPIGHKGTLGPKQRAVVNLLAR